MKYTSHQTHNLAQFRSGFISNLVVVASVDAYGSVPGGDIARSKTYPNEKIGWMDGFQGGLKRIVNSHQFGSLGDCPRIGTFSQTTKIWGDRAFSARLLRKWFY